MKQLKTNHYFLISALILINTPLFSQSSLLNSKINIRLGSSLINSESTHIFSENSPLLYGSLSYNINEIIEVGLYYGTGRMTYTNDLTYNESTTMYEWVSIDGKAYYRLNRVCP